MCGALVGGVVFGPEGVVFGVTVVEEGVVEEVVVDDNELELLVVDVLENVPGVGISWAAAVAAFLNRPAAPTTRRTYGILLGRITAQMPEGARLHQLSAYDYQAALLGV